MTRPHRLISHVILTAKCLFLASKYAILKLTCSRFEGSCPSIAQLEERGTVKENTVRSQGHWFDPGSKDFLLVAAIFRREKRTGRYSCVYGLCWLTRLHDPPMLICVFNFILQGAT